MRKVAWTLLVLMAFAIPWEYALDWGEPWGNAARILGLALLIAAIPSAFHRGQLHTPGPMQWLVLALFLWFCCTYFWTIDAAASLMKIRAYAQELMIVWMVWEFADSAEDLRVLMRAYVAGSCMLAALTLANFRSVEAIAAGQIRFVAQGQDPNDVARFLVLAFPLAALLLACEPRRHWRLMALGYLPVGLAAVVLTASRAGFLAALVAVAGSVVLLATSRPRFAMAGLLGLPLLAAGLWFTVPRETFARLGTILTELQRGDLNQRLNIWSAGWHAFARSPLVGSGVGSFAAAARTFPEDTAHNSALSIAVGGGICAVFLVSAIVAVAARSLLATRGTLLIALATVLLVLLIASLVNTLEENRATWLLLGLMAIAGRLANQDPGVLDRCFASDGDSRPVSALMTTGADGQAAATLHFGTPD